jgi:hypothetical protein
MANNNLFDLLGTAITLVPISVALGGALGVYIGKRIQRRKIKRENGPGDHGPSDYLVSFDALIIKEALRINGDYHKSEQMKRFYEL